MDEGQALKPRPSESYKKLTLSAAHTIKNSNTTTALATYDLNAKCRWVVTATPIQNRLSELFSLFQFLRLYPYDANSGSSWDLDTPEQAIERLKRLLGFVMLRRLNHILALPKRTDIAIPLEMNGQDKARYDQARQATIQYLDDILTSGTVMNGYRNAISQINALRIVCNLGCHVDSGGSTPSHLLEKASDTGRVGGTFSKTDEQSGLDEADSTDELPSTCILCGQLLSASIIPGCEDRRTRSANKSKVDPVGRTGLLRCRYCFSDAIGTMEVSQASLSNSQPGSQHLENNLGIFQNSIASGMAFSTKVNALVKDLQAQSQATKRSVVILHSPSHELICVKSASSSHSGKHPWILLRQLLHKQDSRVSKLMGRGHKSKGPRPSNSSQIRKQRRCCSYLSLAELSGTRPLQSSQS